MDLLSLFIVAFLVFANGFFVAVEFAIVRGRTTKLKSPEAENHFGTKASIRLIEQMDASLSACQLGITMASLLLGWWGELTLQKIFLGWFAHLSPTYQSIFSHALATAIALVIVTFLHVVIGELAAKSIAIRYPEATLRLLALPMVVFSVVCKPLIATFNGCANLLLRMFGVPTEMEADRVHSAAELEMLIAQSTERGILDKEEEEMLQGVFSFSQTVAREVMTPRTEVKTISIDATFDEVVSDILNSRHSRFPVVGEHIDDIKGIIIARDVLQCVPQVLKGGASSFSVKNIMREPYFVPETKPIDDLLNEFKHRNLHMAIVVEEHGGVDGVVTLEDLIEEIVGEIFDESDIPKQDIVLEDNGDLVVDGGVLVSEVNDRLSFSVPEGDYDTIAGFVYSSLGRIPEAGDEILIRGDGEVEIVGETAEEVSVGQSDVVNGFGHAITEDEITFQPIASLVVEKVEGHRIDKIRLKSLVPSAVPESEELKEASEVKEGNT